MAENCTKVCVVNCKMLIVMIWKCLVLRKRNWLLTIFELISPICVVFLLWWINKYVMEEIIAKIESKTENSLSTKKINIPFKQIDNHTKQFDGTTYIAYAPKTALTKKIMKDFTNSTYIGLVESKFNYISETIEAIKSKAELEATLKLNLQPNSSFKNVFGVLFSKPVPKRNNSKFGYKIIGDLDKTLKESITPLTKSILLKLQVYLDSQILKLIGSPFWNTKVLIRGFINNTHSSRVKQIMEYLRNILIYTFYVLFTITYLFLVTDLVRDSVQEKSSGIKEMMRIMGLPTWLIWIHWFIYTMLVQLPVIIVMTMMLSVVPPYVFEVNGVIVWVIFLLFTTDLIMIFFAISCLIDSSTKGTGLCSIAWIFINCMLIFFFEPKNYNFSEQVFLSFFPMTNLCWTLESLHSFNVNKVDWNFNLLFTKGYTGSEVSAGVAIIIFIIEIIFFVLLLAYLDAVKPGRYGVAKPATFIFSWCVKPFQNKQSMLVSDNLELPANFELPPEGTKVGIKIRGLCKTFGMFQKILAVKCVNLDIYENEITVLLGHNGAGKTTTMSMITGLFSPSNGTITVDGKNIYDNLYSYRQTLGLCTQHNLYFPKLTVLEHLIFFGMLKGSSYSQAKKEGIYLLFMLNMFDKKDVRGSKLSGGMQRRLCLSVSLVGNPKVLILDEPTSGLDPENRRHIWDLILRLRGERTILITTHHMEEADVLGDRIAIMGHGQVICCGTTMFLKKLYGTGYCAHVSKKPDISIQEITQLVRRHIPKFEITVVSQSRVDYHIGDEFVHRLPNLFSDLESVQNKITGISISCSTMENVFLRVAELSEENEQKEIITLQSNYTKLTGFSLCFQRFESIVMKRLLYTYRKIISKIIKLLITCLIILAAILIIDHFSTKRTINDRETQMKIRSYLPLDSTYPFIMFYMNGKTAELSRNTYSNKKEVFLVKIDNSSIYDNPNEIYERLMMFMKGLDQSGESNYSSKIPFPVTFIGNYSLLQYESHLKPYIFSNNTANLLKNIPLNRTLSIRNTEETDRLTIFKYYLIRIISLLFFFKCAMTIFMSDLITLIVEERVTGFMYQQIIAGISPLFYLVSNFLCDLTIYIFTVFIWLVIVLIFGGDILPWNSEHLQLLIIVLFLYGISSLFFLNVFALISNDTGVVNSLYIMFDILMVFVCFVGIPLLNYQYDITIIIIVSLIFSLHPSIATTLAIFSISLGVAYETDGYPENLGIYKVESLLSFPTNSNRYTVLISLLLMIFDSILYFCVSFCVDYKLFAGLTHKSSIIRDPEGRNDVALEAQRVRMFNVDTKPLRVEGLVKNYCRLRAVNQVSFLVSQGECFGLLGVNGAGKSTTFKMLTGEITPTSGDAFATKYSVVRQAQKYLSHIGYCPQFDPLLKDLTGKDILTIIAKLRGVPRKEVGKQVTSWMIALGIEEHAKKRTETYSGGTKRKLAAAIAYIGEPEVVLLDEPTTGVDPAARRKVWQVVQDRIKAGYSAVLSSHSMEECEALCTRLTIMRKGQLCCIGSVEELKSKFGQGFVAMLKLSLDLDNFPQLDKLKAEFFRIFPKSVIQDENPNMITFRILSPKTLLSRLFYEIIQLKERYSVVEDFIISSASLEQLFLAITRGEEIYNKSDYESQSNMSLSST